MPQNLHVPVFFLLKEACDFIKKQTLTQVFSCEFCKNFKNIVFTEHLQVTTSVFTNAKSFSPLQPTVSKCLPNKNAN